LKEVPTVKEIRTAMGYVETVGLAAAIAAADAALKAANVRLVGREISKGGGMVTVKLSGNVGAVRAAVAAARAEGARVSEIVSARVIARPALTHGPVMGYNADTMGVEDWLKDLGVQDAPVSVHRPEGARRGAGIRRKAKRTKPLAAGKTVKEPSEEVRPSETQPAPVQAPEAVPVEPEVPASHPVGEEKTISEVPDGKPEAGDSRQENTAETENAEALQGEEAEGAEETVKTETPKRRRRTSRRKTTPVEKTEGEASGRTSKRRTRRKKASDSENNETSGRS
jgi:hypothetical protein